MSNSRLGFFTLSVPILSACMTLAPPITHPTEAIAHANAPPTKTLDAVLNYFSGRFYSIDSVDRKAGFIRLTTPWSGGRCYPSEVMLTLATNDWSPGSEELWGDQYRLNPSARPVLTEFTVRVTGDSARSSVQVAAKWRAIDGQPVYCELSHYWEGGFEDAIRGRAETRAPFWHKAQR